jgi:CheY-like chemotaxis protein
MTKPRPVLYIEDDDNDAFLMERAFRIVGVANPIRILSDGKAAIDHLANLPANSPEAQPCLVVLDLSMPGKNGLEVLKWVRSHPAHSDLPVIVLTSSNQESDIHRAFQLRANGFITKPADANKLLNIVKAINEYWLSDMLPSQSFAAFAQKNDVPVVSRYSGLNGNTRPD